MHTLTFSASRVTCGRRRAGRRPFTPRRCPCRPPAAPGEQTVKGTGLSGALKDVTSNIDDRRLFVRAVPYAAGSPRGYLADFVVCTYSSFSTYPAPGSGLAPFPASRLRASLSPVAASLDASDRALQPLYRLPRLLAPTRGSAPSAGPNTQPSGAPAGAMPRSCVVPVLRPITQRHHATSSRNVNTPVPAPPMPHPARPLPSAPLVTMPQGRQYHCRHGAQSSSLVLPAWSRHPVSPAAQPASKLEGTST